ncbi:hypothetical protein DMB44_05470 [Thermoplasma sp. Kam2015]|uniref:DNA-methyltransferase n=1 Tax=Thermoplasma sp. Kam2015 TaxID=2094122 RepID=UPI000D9E5559|nr:DNA methyltransferase [Thermoplasma sp. Kam2015]PYB68171.1 hypothetical protein DMB44_05470 [Thermoplasma sp. Kam2015]
MKLINSNAIDALRSLPDESVDCVITSPPYYGLRSYKGADTVWDREPNCEHDWISYKDYKDNLRFRDPNHIASVGNQRNEEIFDKPDITSAICSKCGSWKGQLGLEPTYQMYIEHLMMITKEIKRVLKKTGTVFWNMGDSYAGNMGRRSGWADHKLAHTDEEGREKGIAIVLKADYGNIREKSLMMIPERFAIAMIDDGWILRNKIVWRKVNGLPSSVKDRFSNKWEYVFFFTKSKKYYFDLDSVRKPLADPNRSLRAVSGGNKYNTVGKGINPGINKPRPNIRQKYEQNSSCGGKHGGSIRGNPKGANPGDVIEASANADGEDFLSIPTIPHKEAHFAIYPETLVAPLIEAGCPKGGIVLDPFAGSGTTGVVAQILGRDSILIEISSEYCEIIEERFKPENIQPVAVKLIKQRSSRKLKNPQKTDETGEVIEE